MKRNAVTVVSRVLALVAVAFASTACQFLFHRPEVPDELKR
ncbi:MULTISPECIES: cyclic lactone autoinducer peptide [Cohnella]|nr:MULTISPECIES: cyclic lactone autoinducer peptide [Cohnella]MBN2980210.1 cyclic lactone autoinducer peptide [Cohnella algarum]